MYASRVEVYQLGSWNLTVTDILRKLSIQDKPYLQYDSDPRRLICLFSCEGHCWEVPSYYFHDISVPEPVRRYVSTRNGAQALCQELVSKAVYIRDERAKLEILEYPTLWDHILEES